MRFVRSGYGLHPKYLPKILGRRVNRDIEKSSRIDIFLLENRKKKNYEG